MSVEKILEQRGGNYGDFSDCARIQQAIKFAVRSQTRYDGLPDIMREALDMICHKLGRIVNGNPYHADSWQDVIGYAQLVLDRIEDGKGLKPNQGQERRPDDPTELLRRPDIDLTKLSEEGRFDLKRAQDMLKTQPAQFIPTKDPGGFLVGSVEPHSPGTPEDGGHHARQDEPFEERETLHLTAEDVNKKFRMRSGGYVMITAWRDGENFPVTVNGAGTGRRTARGRLNWQLGKHADSPVDLIERA